MKDFLKVAGVDNMYEYVAVFFRKYPAALNNTIKWGLADFMKSFITELAAFRKLSRN
jgi:hypothetical protein